MNRRRLVRLGLLALALPGAALARPLTYALDPGASKVGFGFTLAGTHHEGTMPVQTAKVVVDPGDLTASRVDVTLDAGRARTALPFATAAMIGPLVLDTASHPHIRFVSRAVSLGPDGRISDGATITGDLTVRGTTRPVVLAAGLFRPRGSAPGDLGRLTVQLTGQISRAEFGASGFADLVSDVVTLDITAVIAATR